MILLCLIFLSFFNAKAIEITHGPYLQKAGTNDLAILWHTNKKGFSYIEYGENKLDLISKASIHGQFDANNSFHKIILTDLKPDTKYQYRVLTVDILKMAPYRVIYGDTIKSEIFSFTTQNKVFETFSFCTVNDIHGRSDVLDSLLKVGVKTNPDFYFFNGDMINDFTDENQLFNGFLDVSVKRFASEKPFVYVRGNHETRGSESRNLGAFLHFDDGKYYRAFTHKGVNFIILDSGEDKEDSNKYYYGLADFDSYRSEQEKWLQAYVKTSEYVNAKYRIVLLHMPFISQEFYDGEYVTPSHGIQDSQKKWAPHLKDIDLLVAAHTHEYSFLKVGEDNNQFPILINDDESIVKVEITPKGLKFVVTGTKGNIIDQKFIPKK
ncbi:metallophosphoesterase [Labilibaculum antarcticum]|nr:metallophosphoesterase [Labilibaculum antarcticum]